MKTLTCSAKILFIAWAVQLGTSSALAAPCTDGVNCFCDLVEGRGPLGTADPAYVEPDHRVACVDWEEATLASTASTLPITSDTLNAGGQNVGRPFDTPDSFCGGTNRGGGSWFFTRYGLGSGIWKAGEPASPARGPTCGCVAPLQGCAGTRAFHPTNFWGAGNKYSLAIRRPGEENAFEPSHAPVPILFGNQDAALISQGGSGFRIAPAPKPITHMGYTQAVVYSQNYFTQLAGDGHRVSEAPIKGNEFNPGDFWLFGRQGNSPESEFPFSGFFFFGSAGSLSDCNARIASGQISAAVGAVKCTGPAVVWHSTQAYHQPTDWPAGTLGCVRGELSGMGSGTMRLKEWFQHSTDTSETLVLDATFQIPTGYFNFENVTLPWFNTYTNGLETVSNGGWGPAPDGVKHYRIEDNVVVVTNRPPVSCAQIGVSAGSTDRTPPASPTRLTVQ